MSARSIRKPAGPGEHLTIPEVCAELKAKGVKFTRGPETVRPGTRIAFFEGPEGVSVELLERGPHIA